MSAYSNTSRSRKPRFLHWLLHVLDQGLHSDDASWVVGNSIARIRWPHKSRGTWQLHRDAGLFKAWAIVSEKYREHVDTPNPKSWKCNFRMNLNICKEVSEVRHWRVSKGTDACRYFEFRRTNDTCLVAPLAWPTWSNTGSARSKSSHIEFTEDISQLSSSPTLEDLGLASNALSLPVEDYDADELNKMANDIETRPFSAINI